MQHQIVRWNRFPKVTLHSKVNSLGYQAEGGHPEIFN